LPQGDGLKTHGEVGEVIQLRLADLEPDKGRIFVYGGKGKKDRCTILSPKVWQQLKECLRFLPCQPKK